jgi:plastocyanin
VFSPGAEGNIVEVGAHDLYFTPSALEVAPGDATIELTNHGQVVHNFTVDELGIQVVATPGASIEIEATDLKPGVYQFYCSVSGHRQAGMEGTLTVR